MKKLFNMLTGIIGGLSFGGVLTFMGYKIYSGTPFSFQGSGRRARGGDIVDTAQTWLIDNLGEVGAGGALMAVGVIGGLYFVLSAIKHRDEDE